MGFDRCVVMKLLLLCKKVNTLNKNLGAGSRESGGHGRSAKQGMLSDAHTGASSNKKPRFDAIQVRERCGKEGYIPSICVMIFHFR